jgi:ABC-type molybdate transport system substrate-binding protein
MLQAILPNTLLLRWKGTKRSKTPYHRWLLPGLGIVVVAVAWMAWTPLGLAAGTVSVLYAGSLVNLMEHGIGPAFDKASGDEFQDYAGGSNLLANQIIRKAPSR